jgi:hypothetical protein
MRIKETQKHTDPTDPHPDPEHCKKDFKVLNQTQNKKIRIVSNTVVLQQDFPRGVPNVGIRDQFTVYNIPKGGTVSDSSNPVPELTHFRKNIPDPTSLQVETDLTTKSSDSSVSYPGIHGTESGFEAECKAPFR